MSAQSSKRIEQLAPELENIISASEPIQDLADGLAAHTGRRKDPCGGRRNAVCCSVTSTTTDA